MRLSAQLGLFSMPETNQFKVQINFTKAYKDAEGNAYIEGIASGPEVDLTGERMAPSALDSMIASFKRALIELRDEHRTGWNDDIGEIVELSLTDDYHLFYKAKLDLNLSGAQDLWYRMTVNGKRYGVSIGGSVIKAGREYVADLGRDVYTYFEVALHEISVVRQAAYQYSFANAVTKSLPITEEPMEKNLEGQVEETVQAETHEEVTEDVETVAAEEQSDATTNEEAEVQETATEDVKEEAAAQADAETETAEGDEAQTEVETVEETVVEEAAEAEPVQADATESEDVAKSLTETKAEFETLKKSFDEVSTKVAELTKSLSEKDEALKTAQTEIADVTKKLDDMVAVQEGRKGKVVDKFAVDDSEDPEKVAKSTRDAQDRAFAEFILKGKK